mmetsp:Transcript_20274/g.34880  ORF Transcript_20274/g.34880 Transcript_20274/m.34880 type:complete len:291 (+) Transcript_20274:563-1435(+)
MRGAHSATRHCCEGCPLRSNKSTVTHTAAQSPRAAHAGGWQSVVLRWSHLRDILLVREVRLLLAVLLRELVLVHVPVYEDAIDNISGGEVAGVRDLAVDAELFRRRVWIRWWGVRGLAGDTALVGHDLDVHRHDHVLRDGQRGADNDLVHILAGEDGQDALVEVHDGVVRSAHLVHRGVIKDANEEEVAHLARTLQDLDVPAVEHVERARDVHDGVRALGCFSGGELDDTARGGQEVRQPRERVLRSLGDVVCSGHGASGGRAADVGGVRVGHAVVSLRQQQHPPNNVRA